MKDYKYIIFDIDDTLFDFARSQCCVMAELFARENREFTDEHAKMLWALVWECWAKHRLHHHHDPYVLKNYHRLYDEYLREYTQKIHESGVLSATPEQLYDDIPEILSRQREPYDDVLPVLEALSRRSKLILASNGTNSVQLSRIRNLQHYFCDAFISESMGCIKPDPAFWDIVFAKIDAKPYECLMVGDSLSSDIVGAIEYGMDACWLNRDGRENTSGIAPAYTIRTLAELI